MTASTRSFTNRADIGSDPNRLTLSQNRITVDLSPLAGARVYRATLDPYVHPRMSLARYDIRPSNGGPALQLLSPRFLTFDATQAVRNALSSGQNQIVFNINNPGQGFGGCVSLNVTTDFALPAPVRSITSIQAHHQDGDTILSFKEVAVSPFPTGNWTVGQYENAMKSHEHNKFPKFRYRIYRSTTPFTNNNVWQTAELIDEIQPLSGFNKNIVGDITRGSDKRNRPIPTLPIRDNQLAPVGTAVYCHRAKQAQSAYYYVSFVENGAETLSAAVNGANTVGAVNESVGRGATLKWKSERVNGNWYFSPNMNMRLDFYVRWSSPPYWNTPSEAHNYRVGVPMGSQAVNRPPLTVHLHSWGKHMDIWSRWFHYDDGAILLNPTLNIYNAYTAFHENQRTLKSWSDGTAQPFVQARILDFMRSFLYDAHNIDRNRIALYGESMGGAGTHMFGMRSGHLFSHLLAGVGHNIPAEDPAWVWQFENVGGYGRRDWNIKYSNPQLTQFGYPAVSGVTVWDYFDNRTWLNNNPKEETPYISFSNAPNDTAIGWREAWKVAQAVRGSKRPHNFSWGQQAHGQPIEPMPVPFRLNQSQLAFTNGTLDQSLGGNPNAVGGQGQLNRYMRWNPNSIVDRGDRYEVDILLDGSAPQTSGRVDVTLRRLQAFNIQPNQRVQFGWDGQTREATADGNGLLTLPQLTVSKTAKRLWVTPVGAPPPPPPPPGSGGLADLEIGRSLDSVPSGENLSYTYVVRNTGSTTVNNVVLTADLDNQETYWWSNVPPENESDPVRFTIGQIPPRATARINLVVRVNGTGEVRHVVRITGDGLNTNATVVTPISGGGGGTTTGDLELRVLKSVESLEREGKLSLTQIVTNNGSSAINNVVVTQTVDPNARYIWSTSPNGEGTVAGNRIVLELGSIAPGQSKRGITVVKAEPHLTGNMTNVISVAASGQAAVSETITTPVAGGGVSGSADLRLTLSASRNEVMVGETVTYTVHVKNEGPALARNVVMTDKIDSKMRFVWSDAESQNLVVDNVVVQLGQLAVGETKRVLVVARAEGAGTITNVASVTANEGDPNSANNRVTHVGQIGGSGGGGTLSVQMVASANSVRRGETISYTTIVKNEGTSSVSNVRITDVLANNVDFVWASRDLGPSGGAVIADVGTMTPDEEERLVVVVRVRDGASGSTTNTVSVRGDGMANVGQSHTATIV